MALDHRPARRQYCGTVALVLVLLVLFASCDMPEGDARGAERLGRKIGWAIGRGSLAHPSPLSWPGAALILRLDPSLKTSLGRRAAAFEAVHGDPGSRLRALAASRDAHAAPLLRQAIAAALAEGEGCDLLKAAVQAARAAPSAQRARLAGEFTRTRVVRRWGVAAVDAGIRVADTDDLRRRLARAAHHAGRAPIRPLRHRDDAVRAARDPATRRGVPDETYASSQVSGSRCGRVRQRRRGGRVDAS